MYGLQVEDGCVKSYSVAQDTILIPSVLRVRITRTSFDEIMHESLCVLEIVNPLSLEQRLVED